LINNLQSALAYMGLERSRLVLGSLVFVFSVFVL